MKAKLVLIFLFPLAAFSQPAWNSMIDNKYEFYYTIDGQVLYRIKDDATSFTKKIKKQLFYNQKACDSTGFRLDKIEFVCDGNIYAIKSYLKEPDYKKGKINRIRVYELYKIDPSSKLKLLYSYEGVYITFTDDFKSYAPANKKIITVDWKTGKIDTLSHARFEDFELGIPSEVINPDPIIMQKINNKLIIGSGIADSGERVAERYSIYDINIDKYKFIKHYHESEYKTKPIYDYLYNKQGYEELSISVNYLDLSKKYMYGQITYIGSPARDKDYFFDDNLDTVTATVKKYTYLIGKNYTKNEVVSLNFTTITDSKKEVIISYKLTLPLERSFYRIYTNQLILEEDQKEFTEYEWSMLRNFIYAKHNYQFESEFYQAYFNVFEFYRTRIGKRKKKVEGKFTKSDKENLKLILTKVK